MWDDTQGVIQYIGRFKIWEHYIRGSMIANDQILVNLSCISAFHAFQNLIFSFSVTWGTSSIMAGKQWKQLENMLFDPSGICTIWTCTSVTLGISQQMLVEGGGSMFNVYNRGNDSQDFHVLFLTLSLTHVLVVSRFTFVCLSFSICKIICLLYIGVVRKDVRFSMLLII